MTSFMCSLITDWYLQCLFGRLTIVAFKLGRNMISTIINETSFVMESDYIRQCIPRIVIETTSQASFNHAHTKHVQNGG